MIGAQEHIAAYLPYPSALATRGQYRITFRVPPGDVPDGLALLDQMIVIPAEAEGGESKRIWVHKMEAIEGEDETRIVLVATVIDNVFPIAILAKGAVWAIGGAAVWLSLDKVEKVSQTAGGSIFLIALSVVGVGLSVWALLRSRK